MALTKKTSISKIERFPLNYQIIQVIETTYLLEDGVNVKGMEMNTGAIIYTPNWNINDLPEEIKADAKIYWTKEVRASYFESIKRD